MKEKIGRGKDITGQRFGKLVAIKRIGISKDKRATWLFKCDCGTEKEIEIVRVLHRNLKDCGCLKIGRMNNITGKIFGRLTAIELIGASPKGHAVWLFACDCGVQKEIIASEVLKGSTKSCGCLRYENSCMSKHGGVKTRLYNIWHGMKERCRNPINKDYKNYGGRGIQICDEWKEFIGFRDWALSNGYSDNLSIDRINTNGNYEINNCRWATSMEQGRNKRHTVFHEINGIKKPLIEWCEILNVKYTTAFERNRRSGYYFREDEIQAWMRTSKRGFDSLNKTKLSP